MELIRIYTGKRIVKGNKKMDIEMKKVVQNVIKVMGKRCGIYLLGIFLMSTCWAMFSVLVSLLLKSVVDAAQAGNVKQIPFLIVGNVLGGFGVLLLYRIGAIVYNVEAKRAYATICKQVFSHAIRLPYSYYEMHHSGEFLSKLSYDLERTGDIYGSRLRRTVAPILQVFVFLIPMLVLSWHLALCLVGVNLLMFFVDGFFIPLIKRSSKELSTINSKMTEKISNLLQGMEQVRMNQAGKDTIAEFVKENQNYTKEGNRRIYYSAFLEGSNQGFDLLCSLLFFILGIFFVQNGFTTLGALTAIYSLYGKFSFQFLQLGRYFPELMGCLVNAQRVFTFLEEKEEPENWYFEQSEKRCIENLEIKKDEIVRVQEVDFSYQKERPILQKYTMSVKNGECIAITGASGAGKTTISKLLLGLYPMKSGTIFLNGKSYQNLFHYEIRSQIAYVPQEPYLFYGSIRENIRIGRTEATEQEIEEAAKLAYAHSFILELEQGYDTCVGERGNRLSGGQRQRIAIARAILKDAPILLLDEATSALDNESERLVNQALQSLKHKKTIIMIAHRPSTIALAERNVVMDRRG